MEKMETLKRHFFTNAKTPFTPSGGLERNYFEIRFSMDEKMVKSHTHTKYKTLTQALTQTSTSMLN